MAEGSYHFQVGSLRCTVLSDGYYDYPAEWFFPTADRGELAAEFSRRRLPEDRVLSPYTCLLIESGRRAALVDTGAGAASPTTGAILARLEVIGLRAKDIDTVVFTHAHPDHIGGAVDECGRAVFANAIHFIAEAEWEFWTARRVNVSSLRVPESIQNTFRESARPAWKCFGTASSR
jgi:glyoxylase-like metal-dependent hydrolase (beta-lactamase superfamily II)